jgi:3-oxoacyl-[acyl-carrier protein] reductase
LARHAQLLGESRSPGGAGWQQTGWREKRSHRIRCPRDGDSAFAISAEVSRTSEISRLLDQAGNRFGGLNFFLNNAVVLQVGAVEQITEEQWDRAFSLKVRSVWLLSRAALPHMRKAGGNSIINLASVLGMVAARNRSARAPSKGAMVQPTKGMAIDHGHENIRVNAICRSFVESELTAHLVGQAPDAAAYRRKKTAAHPMGRLGRPEDVAGPAVPWPAMNHPG